MAIVYNHIADSKERAVEKDGRRGEETLRSWHACLFPAQVAQVVWCTINPFQFECLPINTLAYLYTFPIFSSLLTPCRSPSSRFASLRKRLCQRIVRKGRDEQTKWTAVGKLMKSEP